MEVQLEPWSFAKIHIPCLFYSSKVGVRTCWKSEKSGYPKFRRLSISFQCKVIDLFPNQAPSVRLPGLRERSAGMQPPAAPGHYESAPGGPRMFLADLKGHCNMEETKKETSRTILTLWVYVFSPIFEKQKPASNVGRSQLRDSSSHTRPC